MPRREKPLACGLVCWLALSQTNAISMNNHYTICHRSIFFFSILTSLLTPRLTQAEPTLGGSKAERAIVAAYKEWDTAVVKADLGALERILAPEHVFTDSDGSTADKAGMLADYKSGVTKVFSCATSDLKVMVFGDTAVVTGIWSAKMTSKGRDDSGAHRFTDTWVKRNGRWQCVADHLSKAIPDKMK